MCRAYYDEMATKIQALWRGYTVRKVYNMAERRRNASAAGEANKMLKEQLKVPSSFIIFYIYAYKFVP